MSKLCKIINGYAFEYDGQCYILYEVGMKEKGVFGSFTEKTGEMVEYKNVLGYYAKLSDACEACLRIATQKAADSAGVMQLGDYLSVMRQIADEIRASVELTAF